MTTHAQAQCYGFYCSGREGLAKQAAGFAKHPEEALVGHCPACVGSEHQDPANSTLFAAAVQIWLAGFAALTEAKLRRAPVSVMNSIVSHVEATVDGIPGATTSLRREAARTAGWERLKSGIGTPGDLTIPSV